MSGICLVVGQFATTDFGALRVFMLPSVRFVQDVSDLKPLGLEEIGDH